MNFFNTIKIGNQTWKKENLAIDDGGEGIKIINGNYYYTFEAAQRVVRNFKGWRIPTTKDFEELIEHHNLKKQEKSSLLRNWNGWLNPNKIIKKLKIKMLGGYNDTGVSYTISGIPTSGNLFFFDERAYFWTSTEFETYSNEILFTQNAVEITHTNKTEYLPIRLIKYKGEYK